MYLFPVPNIPEEAWHKHGMEGYADLLSMTTQLFELRSEKQEVYGYIGVMQPSFVSQDLWLWISLTHDVFSLAELKLARTLTRDLVSQLDANIYAEVSAYDPKAIKFAEHIGFEETTRQGDLIQYRWN